GRDPDGGDHLPDGRRRERLRQDPGGDRGDRHRDRTPGPPSGHRLRTRPPTRRGDRRHIGRSARGAASASAWPVTYDSGHTATRKVADVTYTIAEPCVDVMDKSCVE